MLITDTFPAPTLDDAKWSDQQTGSVGLVIGSPSDGVYPQNVDDDGDEVVVLSEGKISVPAGQSFDQSIFYENVYTDPDQSIVLFLGWRTYQQAPSGNPAFGIDASLAVLPGPAYYFQKRTFESDTETRDNIIEDELEGADGGFRMERIGSNYSLYRHNGDDWELLQTVHFPHTDTGYVIFGVFAVNPVLSFPWVLQT